MSVECITCRKNLSCYPETCGFCEHQRRERELAMAVAIGALYATVGALAVFIAVKIRMRYDG